MNKKYNRNDILEIGERILRKQGYHHTGIQQLLKEAGIPKGSFYNFFESKEDMALQVLDYYGDSYAEWVRSYMENNSMKPLERIASFYQALIDGNNSAEEACMKGCLVNNFSIEVAGLYDVFAQKTDKIFKRLVSIIAKAIQEGQEAGEINQNYTAEELATFIHTGFFGALSNMKAQRSVEPLILVRKIALDLLSPQ